ncbi:helix-turn-helix domain-containing protein [Anaerorhabdus sp.]|jgi:DNA-binding transcriptional ArsR family regulator|uniref:helix-turn-helix domain-containing protein n=1 Tax=Anaerorhabdus sp. TaxID=1872524 RepID=UPI002FCBBE92
MKDITEIMLNPVRMRIIQTFVAKESITTSEICEKISDIPRTTLYRHINILLDANVLIVVAEKKIRGSTERTLALNIDEIVKHNTLENAPHQAFSFLMNIYSKIEKYYSSEKHNLENNKIFLNNTVMMMDDQEFDQFSSELQTLFLKHSYDVAKGRKPRDISIISSPVDDENE